jgi:hypothetical protein
MRGLVWHRRLLLVTVGGGTGDESIARRNVGWGRSNARAATQSQSAPILLGALALDAKADRHQLGV